MDKVRFGVVGIGVIGSHHVRDLLEGRVARGELTAVADLKPEKMKSIPDRVQKFGSSTDLIRSGTVDAVIVSTPHYGHTTIGIEVLKNDLHLLVEKPISVHKADAERLIAARKNSKLVFGAMFNQRTDSRFRKLRDLVHGGHLGRISRVNWITTDWFRSEQYYASGDWRATWKGEGGGILMNQCPHNLDMLTWICGMPSRVTAFCKLGRWHSIEVEDDVTAYLEYPDGATGVLVATTGEAPGTNRLEIVGEMGKAVLEHGKLQFVRNEVSSIQFCRETASLYEAPPVWNVDVPTWGAGGQHAEVKTNFVDAILDGKPLIAPAEEGLRAVELANAMLYSSLTGTPVDLPLNAKKYEACLQKLIQGSGRKKKRAAKPRVNEDMTRSFNVKA